MQKQDADTQTTRRCGTRVWLAIMVAAVLLAAGVAVWQWSVDTQDGGRETPEISAFGGRVTDVYGSALEIENRDSGERRTFLLAPDTRIMEELEYEPGSPGYPEYESIPREALAAGMIANVVYHEPTQESLEILIRTDG